jgi:hypothetical protein
MRIGLTLSAICLSLVLAGSGFAQRSESVPDSDAAIKIARAALIARFGANTQMEEPLVARLKDNDTWLVQGTLPPGSIGGVGYVEIARKEGRILKIYHEQ